MYRASREGILITLSEDQSPQESRIEPNLYHLIPPPIKRYIFLYSILFEMYMLPQRIKEVPPSYENIITEI